MTKKGKIVRVFPGSNTRKGFFSFYDSVLNGLDKIFILKGGPGTGKSTLVKRIGLLMADRGFNVELLCCSSDNNSLDGVIVPQLKVAIVDGTRPHIIDPKYPGVVEQIINLSDFWDNSKLQRFKEEIISTSQKKAASYCQVYENLAEAYANLDHQEQEKLSNEVVQNLAETLGGKIFKKPQPRLRQMFAGAITPDGPVHYTREIIDGCKKRIRVTGGSRRDKSKFIYQLSAMALEKDFDADLYHCFFDPTYHSMLIIPKLELVIMDNNLPYMGNLLTESEFTDVISLSEEEISSEFTKQATKKLELAVTKLKQAKQYHEELEKYYVQAMDFEKIDKLREKLLSEMLISYK